MATLTLRWLSLALTAGLCWLLVPAPATAQDLRQSRLVDVAWLQEHRDQVLLLDASMTQQHLAGHIPGAVSVDLYRYGASLPTPAEMELRIQSWGVSPGHKIVVYDQGGDMMATRLFYDLHYHGLPATDLFILDGGLARWRAQGGAAVKEPTPAPPRGSYRITELRESVRVRLPEFLVASGDPVGHALVDALDPGYHYGAQRFFDRAGHVPNALPMPHADFYNADKTFKSPSEIRRMLRYLGIRSDQVAHSHCGGGVAASVPWFALQFVAGHPRATLYLESQREWLRDDRGLPFWTYGAPRLWRDSAWLNGWNGRMQRMFDVAQLNIVDVRDAAAHAQGHLPFSINIPADTFRTQLDRPEALAMLLGPASVNPAHEAVILSEGGLTPGAALAFLALEQLGHAKVSVLMASVDDWGLQGFELTKEPTRVGRPQSPREITVPAAIYSARPRAPVLISDARSTPGEYPKVFVASGKAAPARALPGPSLALPHSDLLNADGRPKTAPELWQRISAAGVPRHAEVVLVADDLAEAAINYYIFRLMGWPDVKVWAGR